MSSTIKNFEQYEEMVGFVVHRMLEGHKGGHYPALHLEYPDDTFDDYTLVINEAIKQLADDTVQRVEKLTQRVAELEGWIRACGDCKSPTALHDFVVNSIDAIRNVCGATGLHDEHADDCKHLSGGVWDCGKTDQH